MTSKRQIAVWAALSAMFFVSGCEKKKKTKSVPPPPNITQPQQAATTTLPTPTQPPPTIEPPASTGTAQAQPPQQKPKPKRKPQVAKKTPPPKPAPNTTTTAVNTPPPRITIDNAGVDDQTGNISGPISHTEEVHHRMSTLQLNQSTEENLRLLNRQLTAEEQASLSQIRNFMAQANAATKDGDVIRAHNLALKAHLLSDELARR
jgi:hypothetical protein